MGPRILLDFPGADGEPCRRYFYAPQRIVEARAHGAVLSCLAEVEAFCAGGATAVGFLSYEAAAAFDGAFVTHAPESVPLLWFAIFEHEHEFHGEGTASPLPKWDIDSTRDQHRTAVRRIRDEIAAGSTYQVNLTTRLHAEFHGDALGLYESLRRAQGNGYHAYIETPDWCVLSLSPELFFEVHGPHITARPMKGTRPRGRFSQEDERLVDELRSSPKERAENLMIVDLMRNDIGRVGEAGSVQVTSLYDVERYRTVHQLTSTVSAKLRSDVHLADIFTALFPPGSVTGAPKISTMRLIAELETSARGVYCGAVGAVEQNRSVFNVPIRTIWLDRHTGRAQYGTGGGITADSVSADEYEEMLTKALIVSQPLPTFELLETMRAIDGSIVRLQRHRIRLQESAEYFGFDLCHEKIDAAIAQVTGDAKVRLLVDEHGQARIESLPIDTIPADPHIQIAREPVSSRNRFLFHKTTHRAIYEKHAQAAPHVFDVLLYNERDEITEFTRGNVVVELNGQRVTPPRVCGLLAGVFRGELLDQGVIIERIVTRSELANASRIWFINSVREWVEVRLS